MTTPYIPAAQQGPPPGTQLPNGYRVMGGGYDAATAHANGQGQPAPQHLTTLGQPAPQALPQQPIMQPQGWQPPFQPAQQQPQFPQQQFQQQIPGGPANGQQPLPQQQAAPIPLFPNQPAVNPAQPAAGTDLNNRISGPGIPAELQGRTVGEVIAIANGLRQVHLSNITNPGAGAPLLAPRPIQQPVQQQQQQNGQPAADGWDWRNPAASMRQVAKEAMQEVVQSQLAPAMQPVIANSMLQQAQTARNQIASEVGAQRFAQIEPLVMQNLQGINPGALLNPETWRVATQLVEGKLAQQARMQPQMQMQGQPQQPGGYPVQVLNQQQNPLPNLGNFFTETPMQGGQGPQGVQLNQAQMQAADAMGMSHADYAAWYGGGR